MVGADAAHLLMAIAMAGMLAPGLRTLPDTGWEVVFGVLIAWFAFRVVRDARESGARALSADHCGAPHLVHSGSMLYMFLATTSAAGMAALTGRNELPGSSGSTMLTLDDPALALAFALILIGYSIWDLDQLSGRRYSLAGEFLRSPAVKVGCRVAMGVVMAFIMLNAI